MRFILAIVCGMFLTISHAAVEFLVISDIHYGADNAPKDGQDTGPLFFDVFLKQFATLSKDADFVLNLGDLPTHMLFPSSKKAEYEATVFHKLYQADVSKKPFFYIPGNNDSLTWNYQPFSIDGKSPLNYATDWNGPCLYCDGLMIDNRHLATGGYYSSYVMPNNKDILLIALNSIPFAKIPFLAKSYPNQEEDAATELAWLEQQLKAHHAKQLLLAMHIPPGYNHKGDLMWNETALATFMQLLLQNHAHFGEVTMVVGHTHMDEIRKIRLADGLAIYGVSAPSISRIHHNNPGMKLIKLNEQYTVSNYVTYYTDKLKTWGESHYQAVSSKNSIFPICQQTSLTACLNSLSTTQICSFLEAGHYYGVKSDRVHNACKQTIIVN